MQNSVDVDDYIRNEAIREVVKRMYRTIVANVNDASTIMDWFIQENVFTVHYKQRLQASHIPQDRCRDMIDALLNSTHSTALIVFLKALEEQCQWIAKQINQKVEVLLKDPNWNPPRNSISLNSISESGNGSAKQSEEAQNLQRGQYSKQNISPVHINPTAKRTTPPPRPPKKSQSQESAKSTAPHLSNPQPLKKQLLVQKYEEQICSLDVPYREHRDYTDSCSVRSEREKDLWYRLTLAEERVKDLEDKLRRAEEREKALVAQLEFCRNLTQNQLHQRPFYSASNSDSNNSSPYLNDVVGTRSKIRTLVSPHEDVGLTTELNTAETQETNPEKIGKMMKNCDKDTEWSREEQIKLKPSLPSKKDVIPPRLPPKIPIPKPPVLPKPRKSVSNKEDDPYHTMSFDVPVIRTLNDFEINPFKIQFLEQIILTQHLEVWKGKFNERAAVVKRLTGDDQNSRTLFLNEAEALIKFKHLNVIEILGVTTTKRPYQIILEKLHEDDLLTLLQLDKGNCITPQVIVNFSKQIADGMNYIEKNNYIHRSLNASSVLLTENICLAERVIKISQFRLAAYVGSTNGILQEKEYTATFTPLKDIKMKWTSPEALRLKRWTIKSDVWSYAVLLYEILTYGEPPYLDINDSNVLPSLESGYRLPCPASSDKSTQKVYSVIYNQILLKCWDIIAENRPSFSSLSDFLESLSVGKLDNPSSNVAAAADSINSHPGTLAVSTVGLNRVPSYVKDRYGAFPRLIGEFTPRTSEDAVGGIAVLRKLVYVVRQSTYNIDVYDENLTSIKSAKPKDLLTIEGTKVVQVSFKPKPKSNPFSAVFRRKRKQQVPPSSLEKGLTDIVANITKGWLFFADPSESRIHKFDPMDIKNSYRSWRVEGDPQTISLNADENLLICCLELKAILMYSSDGQFIKKLNPEIPTFGPLHAVPMGRDNIIYCHELDDNYPIPQLWICDNNAKEVAKLSVDELLSSSTYLSVDPYSNQIITVDSILKSIWLVSSTGKSPPRELLTFDQSARPVRICLRRNSGELYVGMQDGRVLVYEVIKSVALDKRYDNRPPIDTDELDDSYETLPTCNYKEPKNS